MNFQQTLASAIFRLDDMYRRLHQEKKALISKKSKVNAEWFRLKMRSFAAYQEVIKIVISVGRAMGDSFAWVFYERNRDLLIKHLEHEQIAHTPPGIGGRGELEFIRRAIHIERQLVLYHGITTFLRVGDFSLVDLRTRTVTALGEIKSQQTGPDELQISFTVISPKPVFKTKPASSKSSGSKSVSKLPQHMEQVFQRQLKDMAASFGERKPDTTAKLQQHFHFDELKRVALGLQKKSVVYEKAGEGLLLMGIRVSHTKSLSSRMLGRSSIDLNKRMKDMTKQAIQIVDMQQVNKPNNANSVYIGNLSFETIPGTVPIFWWPVPTDFLREFFFQEIKVATLYNPAHLIRKLRNLGYDVELLDGGGLKVSKVVDDDSQLLMEGMHYFLSVVQSNLIAEDSIIDTLTTFLKSVESGEVPKNAQVRLQIFHALGRLPRSIK